jgi:predicted metal-dependent HD superfamily phosphohydrolase
MAEEVAEEPQKRKKSAIEKAAEAYIVDLFVDKLSTKYVYHTINHTRQVAEAAADAALYYELPEAEREVLILAAWFHDAGYTKTYLGHEENSVSLAKAWLSKQEYPQDRIDRIATLILSTKNEHEPSGQLEEILHDADRISIGKKSFFRQAELLRLEWEVFLDKEYSPVEWDEIQQDYLVRTNFLTDYFRKEYGKRREKNIHKQRESLAKTSRKHTTNKELKRGVETMYRSTYKNHINLSSMADSKANMMISINTLIMSILITVVGGSFSLTEKTFVENLRYVVPICILLVGSLTSVIFAILSARPNVTNKEVSLQKIKQKKSSVLFFGNFTNMSLKEFILNMNELTEERDLLYDNMTIDIYFLGLVLTRKYKQLRISYNVFMAGLVLAVVAFLGIFFYSQYHQPIIIN